MKRLILIFALCGLLLPSAYGETMDDLIRRDGLYYKKFTDVPFTGNIKSDLIKGKISNGTREGPWIKYHETGQLMWKGSYKGGKQEGEWVEYNLNGTVREKGSYKDGKREGEWGEYWEQGHLRFKGTYKGGKRHGHGTWITRLDYKYTGAWKEGKFWTGTEYDNVDKVIATHSEGVRKPWKFVE